MTEGHDITRAAGYARCTCGRAWHIDQYGGVRRTFEAALARHIQAAAAARRSAARSGVIDPPISEWSLEDYEAFRASGQLS